MIVFGLGNPGLRYRGTRHNVGFRLVESLARSGHARFAARRGYQEAHVRVSGHEVMLIKPLGYMNRSGLAVRQVLAKTPDEPLIVLDDLTLSLGRLRLRSSGSDGGHLGLRSIIVALGTDQVARLRIGIGRATGDAVDHVLGRFRGEEKRVIAEAIDAAQKGIAIVVTQGIAAAQNYLNALDLGTKRASSTGT